MSRRPGYQPLAMTDSTEYLSFRNEVLRLRNPGIMPCKYNLICKNNTGKVSCISQISQSSTPSR